MSTKQTRPGVASGTGSRVMSATEASVPQHNGGDGVRRRLRLHHVLVRRRRWSRELDWLCRSLAAVRRG
jgi:hypothetical protein